MIPALTLQTLHDHDRETAKCSEEPLTKLARWTLIDTYNYAFINTKQTPDNKGSSECF